MHMNYLESAARRKLKASPEWRAFKFEAIEDWYLIEGKIPEGAYASGPRKGQPKWGAGDGQKTILTAEDVDEEMELYERTTGLCRDCFGSGKVMLGWSKEKGKTFRRCPRCGESGKAAE